MFEGLKISRSSWMCELNRHPVVALSFLNVKADSAEGMLRQLSGTLLGEYRRYLPVVDGSGLPGERSAQFYHIYQILRRAEDSEELRSCLKDSVSVLCQMLEDIYQKKVYLFLDEYDTPFLSASEKGYYDAVRDVLSGLIERGSERKSFAGKGTADRYPACGKGEYFFGTESSDGLYRQRF